MKDTVMPSDKWEFDADVTNVFEDMLRRSIPEYDTMRHTVFDVACKFQQEYTDIVDLGCSRGDAMASLIDKFDAHNHFIGVEVSQPMLAVARDRFKGLIDCHVVEILDLDLRTHYPPANASVTLCILTLQFTPIEHRQRILRDIWQHTIDGGCLILVEKVLGSSADIDALMVNLYYGHKRNMGYTEEQIQRKRLALEGVLVPVTARWNEELLHMAGFDQVDCFWRYLNFCGWVAVK